MEGVYNAPHHHNRRKYNLNTFSLTTLRLCSPSQPVSCSPLRRLKAINFNRVCIFRRKVNLWASVCPSVRLSVCPSTTPILYLSSSISTVRCSRHSTTCLLKRFSAHLSVNTAVLASPFPNSSIHWSVRPPIG